jgi:hypothetical protein
MSPGLICGPTQQALLLFHVFQEHDVSVDVNEEMRHEAFIGLLWRCHPLIMCFAGFT